MNKTHLETFRGLINQFDLDLNYNMKLSFLDKVLEDSMSFLSSLYEKKINIDIDTIQYYPSMFFNHHLVGEIDEIWTSPHYQQHL